MRYLNDKIYGTLLEVDLDAIVHNLGLFRARLKENARAAGGKTGTGGGTGSARVGVIPIVKASAYGHGAFEVASVLQRHGVDYLAVAFTSEGIALRKNGITMPIVVFNADADSFEELIRHRLEPEIYNFVSLSEFVELLKRHGEEHYPIHIKLDTGMHRLGFGGADTEKLIAELTAAEPYIHVATIFSHLAAADEPSQDDFTRRQIADFDRVSRRVASALPYPVRRHTANTNGAARFPEAGFDLVRLGIGLYGIRPQGGVWMEGIRPVAQLKTRIINIAELAAGETVGYGRRGVLTRPSRIATVPIGYADGLNRRLSGGAWSMLVGGRSGAESPGGSCGATPAPIVGNVCMDSCMIDITDAGDVKVGDEAVIFSAVPGNTIEDMAAALGTIPYEVMTSISARVKRIYINE